MGFFKRFVGKAYPIKFDPEAYIKETRWHWSGLSAWHQWPAIIVWFLGTFGDD